MAEGEVHGILLGAGGVRRVADDAGVAAEQRQRRLQQILVVVGLPPGRRLEGVRVEGRQGQVPAAAVGAIDLRCCSLLLGRAGGEAAADLRGEVVDVGVVVALRGAVGR